MKNSDISAQIKVPFEEVSGSPTTRRKRIQDAVESGDYGSGDRNPLRTYLQDIGKTALLKPQERSPGSPQEFKMAIWEARNHMIQANPRLVVKIANDYSSFGLPLIDLIGEGNVGLIKAVERFDPSKGGKLSTYAAWWIKQSIKRLLTRKNNSPPCPLGG